MPYIEFKNVCKEYKMGEVKIKALNNTNFSIEKGELVVIVGPSGAGKGTICKALLNKNDQIKLSVSATTRKPRNGEVHGVNYFFIEKEEFTKMIENGEFL